MSIYTKIRMVFLVSTLFVTALFFSSFYIKKSQHIETIANRYMHTSLFLQNYFNENKKEAFSINFSSDKIQKYLNRNYFRLLFNQNEVKNVRKNATLIKERKVSGSTFRVLRINNQLYFSLEHPKFSLLLLDTKKQIGYWQLYTIYVITLFFLLGLYFWLTKSLRPLKLLQTQIQKVVEGDLSVVVKSDKQDEIAQVANAFDDALRKLESLINSRQLFLRSIMHELNTPIGKGKILNSFLKDKNLKAGYAELFERLELIVKEFSKIEQMLSSNYEPKIAKYNAKDLVEQGLELMMMNEASLEKCVTFKEVFSLPISTDFALFPLAIKNLIDNAIKYSSDNSVKINISKNSISIASKGEQFTQEIEKYFKPFHGESEGLGLGLYIVHTITEMLNIKLVYLYKGDENIFVLSVLE
jgi:two-component system OmpR family sensor kinase